MADGQCRAVRPRVELTQHPLRQSYLAVHLVSSWSTFLRDGKRLASGKSDYDLPLEKHIHKSTVAGLSEAFEILLYQ